MFEDERYQYRIFFASLAGPVIKIHREYVKCADVENLVDEAKCEGLDAIASAKFKTN